MTTKSIGKIDTKRGAKKLTQKERYDKLRAMKTKKAKAAFLVAYRNSMGIAKVACDATGTARATFYLWYKDDADFAKEVEKIIEEQMGEVEDRLLKAIAAEEPWAIAFYLGRRHPNYKPNKEAPVMPNQRTLEDLIDDYKKRQQQLKNGTGNIKQLPSGGHQQPPADRIIIQHQGQEGANKAV